MTDWKNIKETVEVRGRAKTGNVERYAKICKELLSDGSKATVGQLAGWIFAGLNEGKKDEEPKIKVNWATVKHALEQNGTMFRQVSKNTYELVKKAPKPGEQKK